MIKNIVPTICLTTALAVSACGYANPKEDTIQSFNGDKGGQTMNDEQILSGIYRQINQAMLAKDTTTIDRLTADAFTLTHITGYKQSKDEWLNHIKTDKMQYHKIDEQSVQVAINGKRADIVGKAKTRATIWGANGTWNLQLHYQAVKTDGAWQVQSAVATLY